MSFCEVDLDDQTDFDLEISQNCYDRRELEQIVPTYILNYFSDKSVPDHINLLSPKYIDLCIDKDLCSGIDLAYSALEKSGRFESSSSEHSIGEDIRFIIKILGGIKKFAPKEFSAGILLMHLEIIEGILTS